MEALYALLGLAACFIGLGVFAWGVSEIIAARASLIDSETNALATKASLKNL